VTVCGVYVFAPYVATVMIGDQVEGMAQIADLNKWAGLCAALMAPILGAAADRAGGRKGPLGLLSGLMIACIAGLWLVEPGTPQAGLWFPLLLAIGAMFPLTEALHNAMLAGAAPPQQTPKVSGLALVYANAATFLILVFVLWFFAFPGNLNWPGVPTQPLFGLDAAKHEPSRVVGIICAIWFAILAIPFFLFTHDQERGLPWLQAAKEGLRGVGGTIRKVGELGDVGRFLIARMIYTDGKTAMIVLGGVYAAVTMKWGMIEMTIYGIVLSVAATCGGFVSSWLDNKLGPKRAIEIEVLMCLFALIGMVSIDRQSVFFMPASDQPIWSAPFFKTAPELIFVGVVCVAAVFITAAYASSRTMMVRLAPPHMVGELFGLYALAGTATAWIGPMLVSTVTRAADSQRIGFGALGLLLILGLILLRRVADPPAAPSSRTAV
jgi:MFS transporter, UMF1 family